MTAFQQMDSDILLDSNLSESITYSRVASTLGAALAPFQVQGSPNMGGEYASPTGPVEGSVFLRLSDIPGGPQKGDLLVIASLGTGRFFVQEIFKDASGNWADVKIRLAPK